VSTTQPLQKQAATAKKWQNRFDFFDAHGAPNHSRYTPALKALPGKMKRRINVNFIAFFFGPIYLFVLGCGRKTWPSWAFQWASTYC
jgi:hypothetical protein